MTSPSIEPIKIDFMFDKLNNSLNKSLNQAKNVIKETPRITPGNAYPDIEKAFKYFNVLLLVTLLPQLLKKEKNKSVKLDKITIIKVFKFKFIISKSKKYLGNFRVQYNIWESGKIKLKNKRKKQNKNIKKDLKPDNLIFGIGLQPLEG